MNHVWSAPYSDAPPVFELLHIDLEKYYILP